MTEWGNENDYKEMFNSFETLKEFYTNKGIPIIIVEVMVLTKQKKMSLYGRYKAEMNK